jgi:hypothetical protein
VKTPLIFALSGTLLSPIANAVTLGTSEANLLAEKGPPISKAAVGTRAIYRWNDSEITVIDGVVTGVSNRDIQRENAERERSAKANAEQKAKLAVREATSRQETQARPARDFIIDEKTIQARKSKVEFDEKSLRSEIEYDKARRASLLYETDRLRKETRAAYIEGDRARSRALREEYEAKMREKEALEKKKYKPR